MSPGQYEFGEKRRPCTRSKSQEEGSRPFGNISHRPKTLFVHYSQPRLPRLQASSLPPTATHPNFKNGEYMVMYLSEALVAIHAAICATGVVDARAELRMHCACLDTISLTRFSVQATVELATTYAALILADDGIEITVRASLARSV